jgi:hypothetical protein
MEQNGAKCTQALITEHVYASKKRLIMREKEKEATQTARANTMYVWLIYTAAKEMNAWQHGHSKYVIRLLHIVWKDVDE